VSRIALVTGAGSGIGRAAALKLQSNGYDVVLTGRRQAELDKTASLGSPTGGRFLAVPADIGKPDQVDRVFAALKSEFGRIDVLFNNAGMGAPPIPMDELTFEQWSAVVSVNLTGAFLCAQRAMALMKTQDPRGGRIINNGSISATAPRPHSAPYTATKHAISGLTKSIALDGRPFDITASQIDIGNAATPMTEHTAIGTLQAHGVMAPEPRMDVEHVADAVLMMANLPLESNILTMTIMATKMPFVGRG
jgi:NAD(P)-dependent dehydrogenase (short-subunit alcohol dehydrogenase family)